MDLDLRKLRYFAAVAEELHFGRAAAKLFIAQPVLSRQVRALEREVGVRLLDRTSRSVALTPAGGQLYDDARSLLAAAAAAARRAHDAARGSEKIVVGFAPGLRVAPAVAAFGQAIPGVQVELAELPWHEGAAAVADGRADVACVRDPAPGDGLVMRRVGTDPKVAVMAAGHRLAARRFVRQRDLAEETLVETDRRSTSVEAYVELAASGRDIAVVPRTVARAYARRGLVTRRIADREPQGVYVVLPANPRQHAREFFDVAVSVLSGDGAG